MLNFLAFILLVTAGRRIPALARMGTKIESQYAAIRAIAPRPPKLPFVGGSSSRRARTRLPSVSCEYM